VEDPRKSDRKSSALRSAGLLLAIPSLLIAAPLVGFFAGRWLDGRLGTVPWLSFVGVVLGFVAAGRETHQIYRRYLAEEEENRRRR
jgi:F0F1-type ATP synthase assembly protein I